MSKEKLLVKYFEKCPICGCPETVTKKAAEGNPDIPLGTFVCAERISSALALKPPMPGQEIQNIFYCYDVCWECGTRYCTKVEEITVKIPAVQIIQTGGIPRGNHPPILR